MKKAFLSAGLAGLLSIPATGLAQPAGVTEVAPGVRVIDGSKVAVLSLSGAVIRQAVADNPKFSAIEKMLGSEGITNPGPQGKITTCASCATPTTNRTRCSSCSSKAAKCLICC